MSEGGGGFFFGALVGAGAIYAIWRLKGRPEVLRQVRQGVEGGARDVPEAVRPIAAEALRRVADEVVGALNRELP